ncbi:hypothetical protein IAT40_003598 [Kwoniella sp. CBS 6097]
MSNPPQRGKPSLIAAAQAQNQAQASASASASNSAVPPNLASVPMSATNSSTTISDGSGGGRSISARSTPAPGTSTGPGSRGGEGSVPPAGGVQKLKFKPKVPIRRVKQEPDVKPDISQAPAPAVRGGIRGRGRGGPNRGRGRGTVVSTSIAAGVFGGPRPAASSSSSRRFAAAPVPAPRNFDDAYAEVYSDHSDEEGTMAGRPIDIDMVSTMSESAPTSLYRDRRLNQGKAKGKPGKDEKDRKDKDKGKKKAGHQEGGSEAMDVDQQPETDAGAGASGGFNVKAEPISPEKQPRQLREDDAMLSDDETQDRDERGRRVRSFAATGGVEEPAVGGGDDDDDEGVNAAQAVDLSESEEEEEEEDMEGDFVQADGYDNPEEKLFIFQFPNLFPKFAPSDPVDLTQEVKPDSSAPTGAAAPASSAPQADIKPDIKPTAAQLRAGQGKKGQAEPLPEGRVGTMVVMKSGKVKMVMGKDIVMNVTPGLPATFIQHLVHLDGKSKSAQILGEVHKNYVVTPDIDRLLQELYINGGKTPGELETERRRRIILEKGLIPMKKERD